MSQSKIAFPHRPPVLGGPGSFQTRLESYMRQHGWTISYAGDAIRPDIVFVVGGTRRLIWLLWCKVRGAKLVLRLDGINWQHRVANPGWITWCVLEIHNALSNIIRRWLADVVVYQSLFVRAWWHHAYGHVNKKEAIIYNGVDLNAYRRIPIKYDTQDVGKIVCVEGTVNGLPALSILVSLSKYKIEVYGQVDDKISEALARINLSNIMLCGVIPREMIPEVYKGKCIYLCLETNPPCPNSVIEAMSAGVPVIGFDSGSLLELVSDEAGVILPYVTDAWKLESPQTAPLEQALEKVLLNYEVYSEGARSRAERLFGLDKMGDSYLKLFEAYVTKGS